MAVGEHVRELTDLLRVADGLVERHGEVVRAENGEVRVRALHFLERVAVHDGETVVVILLRNKAAGILAERADLVLERRGITPPPFHGKQP